MGSVCSKALVTSERPILPSNLSPLGALPARFRRVRVLIIGCGDVGLRVVRALAARRRVLALTSSPARVPLLRAAGVTPLMGDLDDAATLARLAGIATHVVHLAPPPAQGERDLRTTALAHALARRTQPRALVYVSTSGVYGDCGGAWVSETHPVAPATPRALRRVHAEEALRALGRLGVRVGILRAPGIYAADRPNGTPRERLLRGTPVLRAEDDVYINHIHADDLARACVAALWRGAPQRIYHASGEDDLRMGEYFDLAADLYGLPRPPRVSGADAQALLPPALLGFMGASRRLVNRRLHEELRLRLRYPTVRLGLTALLPNQWG